MKLSDLLKLMAIFVLSLNYGWLLDMMRNKRQ